ncbi:MAG: Na+/H+ antiporter NhaC [Negativicutes bacterium]|nr:Na+/H+ antiporter NhaC [Negativicutes bacterium]
MENEERRVSFGVAVLNISILVLFVAVGNGLLKFMPLDVAVILAITVMTLTVRTCGFKAEEVLGFAMEGARKQMGVIGILMFVGALIGSWIVAGIVPTMVYYGLKFLSPTYFLLTGFLLLCLVSFFIGSTYATAGTIGIALMSIGYGMGYPSAITAGMVVSGSIFGNKISPFADSTNLCIAVTGVELMDHIKSMLYTVVPIFFISAALYTYLGFAFASQSFDPSKINVISETLAKNFTISPWLLIIPALTIGLIVKKVPPVMALLVATLLGAFAAVISQPYDLATIFAAVSKGMQLKSGVPQVDSLINRGGISSMMGIVELVIFLLASGEILHRTGTTTALLEKIDKLIHGPRSLVLSTLLTGFLTDAVTCSQYIAIILPGQMLKEAYQKVGVRMSVLSRSLEDSGTIFSFWLPWSANAVTLSGIVGVFITDSYIYAFQLCLTPIFAAFYGITGLAVWRDKPQDSPPETCEPSTASAK